jgi:5-methylcytosine-specific restriction endonuclease McrA
MVRKGSTLSDETKKQISLTLSRVLKGRRPSQKTIDAAKIANSKPKSEEHKQKLREANLGKKQSAETITKRVAKITGQRRTEEVKERMRQSNLGKNKGEKSGMWLGGRSFEPYNTDWNDTLKRAIRERDHYTCKICGGEGYPVHHIDYDKKNCNPDNLVTLCLSCHPMTNSNRAYWESYLKEDMMKRKEVKVVTDTEFNSIIGGEQ